MFFLFIHYRTIFCCSYEITIFSYFFFLLYCLGAKYIVLRDGELHIRNAARSDSFRKYRCLIKNLLTGNVTPSVSSGQLIVTGILSINVQSVYFSQTGTFKDSYWLSYFINIVYMSLCDKLVRLEIFIIESNCIFMNTDTFYIIISYTSSE